MYPKIKWFDSKFKSQTKSKKSNKKEKSLKGKLKKAKVIDAG